MTQNTTPSEAFTDETQDNIAEEAIPVVQADYIHYYGSELDVEKNQ